MDDLTTYIASGVLEMYVLGLTTEQESAELKNLSEKHEEIKTEIEAITSALEHYAVGPDFNPTLKTFVMATIDYSERMLNGEHLSFPGILTKDSKITDFNEWLNRKDMTLPDDFDQAHAKIIAYSPQMTTAIVWLRTMSPPEIHSKEYEKFLIIEGSCNITIGDEVYKLKAGDFLEIPLFVTHNVMVTSKIPCTLILQRVAA